MIKYSLSAILDLILPLTSISNKGSTTSWKHLIAISQCLTVLKSFSCFLHIWIPPLPTHLVSFWAFWYRSIQQHYLDCFNPKRHQFITLCAKKLLLHMTSTVTLNSCYIQWMFISSQVQTNEPIYGQFWGYGKDYCKKRYVEYFKKGKMSSTSMWNGEFHNHLKQMCLILGMAL